MKIEGHVTEQPMDRRKKLMIATVIPFVIPAMVIGQLFVLAVSAEQAYFPAHDALMQVISCCAQIIAGLYGITLAGYTFFLSRIDALMATDHTLVYITSSIKQRYKYLIWYITVNVAATLIASVLMMYFPTDWQLVSPYLYRVVCNEFLLFFGFAVSLILYYSVSVINPKCIESEARKLKKRISAGAKQPGGATEFILLYDQIQERCIRFLPGNVRHQLQENKGNNFEYVLELLPESNPAAILLMGDLVKIHRYYGCMVNCRPMSASQEMCALAKRVLKGLNTIS